MGQYYEALVIDGNNSRVYSPSQVNMGLKLTEHAYITSEFVNVVLHEILNAPKRIAWVGDYSLDSSSRVPTEIKEQIKEALPKYEEGKEYEYPYPYMLRIKRIEDCQGMYLLNHDKKECVSLEKYIEKNARVRLWTTTEAEGITFTDMDVHCLSPLALLTACGNGMGGGDYEGSDLRAVGSWALDRIELRKLSPSVGFSTPIGYKLINPRFIESWIDDND